MPSNESTLLIPETSDPLIAIDGCFLTDFPHSSLATYLRSLLKEWQKLERPPRILLCIPQLPTDLCDPVLFAPNVRLVLPDCPCKPSSRFRAVLKWHQWHIPLLLRKYSPDLYFSPFHLTPQFPFGMTMVSTIHDLCFLTEPPFSLGSLVHRFHIMTACIRAKKLVCVSKYTAAVLNHWWPRAGKRSVVVQNGYDGLTMSEEEATRILSQTSGKLIPRAFFIWIGIPSHRKNIKGLMDSFALYLKNGSVNQQLVMVAPERSHGILRKLALERGIEHSLVLLSNINESTRDALYRCATALVFPSHCEGFGYPVLEAMMQGCPPISRKQGPSREIVGNSYPLVEKIEPAEFANAMIHAAALTASERLETSSLLIKRASQFSVKSMANKTLRVIMDAVN